MAFVPAGGEAALGAWTLVAAFGFVVCAGLLWTWRNTIGAVFAKLASYSIGLKYIGHIHPLAPLGAINDSVEGELSFWADASQKQFGLALHYSGELFQAMSKEISQLSQDTLSLGHSIIHEWVPNAIEDAVKPWRTKTNKAAAAAGAAGALAALLRKVTRAEHHAQQAANQAARAATRAAAAEAGHAKSVATTVERTVVHDTKVITQVIEVGALPAQFGRTVKQIRRRLGRAEAWVGATALAVAMANVLGIANPRCLRDGPIGRVSRALCGIPTNLLNDLLGLIVDFFILENVCTVLPFLEAAVSEVAVPLVAVLTDVGAGLCHGSIGATKPLQGPVPVVPPVTYADPLAA